MKKHLAFVISILLSSHIFAAEWLDENGTNLLKASKLYTLSNLHPDTKNNRLYAVNYQLPALMPLCTEVSVKKLKRKALVFEANGIEYTYLNHKAAAEPFKQHLLKFFGTSCNKSKVKKLSQKDQEGIKLGRALPGMTKQGVLYAMGRPPLHVNPSLDANEWMYWRNKFARKAVMFNSKGIVTGTR